VPISSLRVVLAAPAARKAKLFAHNLPGGAKPVHRIERGRESWTYAFDALAPWRTSFDDALALMALMCASRVKPT
jgi:hypothetical protein